VVLPVTSGFDRYNAILHHEVYWVYFASMESFVSLETLATGRIGLEVCEILHTYIYTYTHTYIHTHTCIHACSRTTFLAPIPQPSAVSLARALAIKCSMG
jgi:hypothetical protein